MIGFRARTALLTLTATIGVACIALPSEAQPAPDHTAEDGRIRALEEKLDALEKRTVEAEQKAEDAKKEIARLRADRDAEVALAKKKAEDDEEAARKKTSDDAALAKKKAEDDQVKALDFGPEKQAFDFGDFSWMPGNYGASERPFSYGPFAGELRVDTAYHFEFSRPIDDTISGSSEAYRHNEIQLTQLGIGGDFYYKGMQARLMTQLGL